MRPEPTPRELARAEGAQPEAWLALEFLVVLVRVVVAVALAVGLFLLIFLGYITLPLFAPILLGAGYAVVMLWRRGRRQPPRSSVS